MRYIDQIDVIPPTDPGNALILGSALHKGIEEGTEAGIRAYFDSFPIIDDLHINEQIKLEALIPLAVQAIPEGNFEVELKDEVFHGFIDLVSPNPDGTVDIWDFKYSGNGSHYEDSKQLHIYQFYFEKIFKKKVHALHYVLVPKIKIRQKKTESLFEFRKRIMVELEGSQIEIMPIPYDPQKVKEFQQGIETIRGTNAYPREPNRFCDWCDYQEYCEKGIDYMLLPKNKRRNIQTIEKKVVWLYGAPFSGKTHLANQFPDPLMLNTDGNIKFVNAPYIPIKDDVKVEGRLTKRTLAWQVFKDAIEELEKKQNDFKTIVVDLLEDCYEHCRIFMYDKLNITHESDDSFAAWDKVRTEFLSTLKRLMNLDYENIILISHEDRSKDISKKAGDKVTSIKPNLADKVSNKVAGMVDIVARVVADGNNRTLSFKTDEVIFGGGRLTVTEKVIPLEYADFMLVYKEANMKLIKKASEQEVQTELVDFVAPKVQETEPATEKKTRKRKDPEPITVEVEDQIIAEEPKDPDPVVEAEEPKTRTRKKRGE